MKFKNFVNESFQNISINGVLYSLNTDEKKIYTKAKESGKLMKNDLSEYDQRIANGLVTRGLLKRRKNPQHEIYFITKGRRKAALQKPIEEVAPPDSQIEKWIEDNEERFKERYGKEYKKYLYGKAWNKFNGKPLNEGWHYKISVDDISYDLPSSDYFQLDFDDYDNESDIDIDEAVRNEINDRAQGPIYDYNWEVDEKWSDEEDEDEDDEEVWDGEDDEEDTQQSQINETENDIGKPQFIKDMERLVTNVGDYWKNIYNRNEYEVSEIHYLVGSYGGYSIKQPVYVLRSLKNPNETPDEMIEYKLRRDYIPVDHEDWDGEDDEEELDESLNLDELPAIVRKDMEIITEIGDVWHNRYNDKDYKVVKINDSEAVYIDEGERLTFRIPNYVLQELDSDGEFKDYFRNCCNSILKRDYRFVNKNEEYWDGEELDESFSVAANINNFAENLYDYIIDYCEEFNATYSNMTHTNSSELRQEYKHTLRNRCLDWADRILTEYDFTISEPNSNEYYADIKGYYIDLSELRNDWEKYLRKHLNKKSLPDDTKDEKFWDGDEKEKLDETRYVKVHAYDIDYGLPSSMNGTIRIEPGDLGGNPNYQLDDLIRDRIIDWCLEDEGKTPEGFEYDILEDYEDENSHNNSENNEDDEEVWDGDDEINEVLKIAGVQLNETKISSKDLANKLKEALADDEYFLNEWIKEKGMEDGFDKALEYTCSEWAEDILSDKMFLIDRPYQDVTWVHIDDLYISIDDIYQDWCEFVKEDSVSNDFFSKEEWDGEDEEDELTENVNSNKLFTSTDYNWFVDYVPRTFGWMDRMSDLYDMRDEDDNRHMLSQYLEKITSKLNSYIVDEEQRFYSYLRLPSGQLFNFTDFLKDYDKYVEETNLGDIWDGEDEDEELNESMGMTTAPKYEVGEMIKHNEAARIFKGDSPDTFYIDKIVYPKSAIEPCYILYCLGENGNVIRKTEPMKESSLDRYFDRLGIKYIKPEEWDGESDEEISESMIIDGKLKYEKGDLVEPKLKFDAAGNDMNPFSHIGDLFKIVKVSSDNTSDKIYYVISLVDGDEDVKWTLNNEILDEYFNPVSNDEWDGEEDSEEELMETKPNRLKHHTLEPDSQFAHISAERNNPLYEPVEGETKKIGKYKRKKREKQKAENNRNTEQLKQDIKDLGLSYIKTYGAWHENDKTTKEKSFIIPNISKEDAMKLGKKYKQYSIIFKPSGEDTGSMYVTLDDDSYGLEDMQFIFNKEDGLEDVDTNIPLTNFSGYSGLKKNGHGYSFKYKEPKKDED